MTGNKYQELAMRTNDGGSTMRLIKEINCKDAKLKCVSVGGVLNACLGLAGEVGELNDLVKKAIFHEKEVDTEHLKKELGDVMWYVSMMCQSMGWELDEILQMNVDKLMARYPDGFDTVRANNRKEGDI